MNFVRSVKLLQKYNNNYCKVLTVISRHAQLNVDWQPGPYPETEEERIAAAKKYYMLPEEYEPYPKDFGGLGGGLGDYPRLPFIHYQDKDPWYPFDYIGHRSSFKEPIPYHSAYMTFDTVSITEKMPVTLWQCVYRFIGVWIAILSAGYVGEKIPWCRPALIEHSPRNGEFYFYPEN